MNKNVIGVFYSEEEAIRKVEELETQGLNPSDIYAVAKDEDDLSMVRGRTNIDVRSAGGGNWFDRFVSFITGEEPVRDALHNAGLTGPEMDDYYRDIDNGAILLYVDEEYGRLHDEKTLFTDEDSANVSNVDAIPHTDADVVPHSESGRMDSVRMSADEDGTDEARMELHEEKLRVDKEEVETGEVRVQKNIVEEEQSIDVPVSREEVYIERRPVDGTRSMDEPTAAFNEDDQSIRIPLREEKVEVSKKPVVNEELIVGKKKVEDTETVRETVRREEADIDGPDEIVGQAPADRSMETGRNDNLTMDSEWNKQNARRNMGINEDYGNNVSNGLNGQSQLDEELEKRRIELDAKNYNPPSKENRDNRFE
ncbi:YsnF/AvaK domain-containing protein [Siminovitchia sediminis]|uniref:YsnF/AvaK domain-containing protein n=1 Tax=Siminovitchia sediminis TaxID=1274353 RepID=A0ABW4KHA5_9BACI